MQADHWADWETHHKQFATYGQCFNKILRIHKKFQIIYGFLIAKTLIVSPPERNSSK